MPKANYRIVENDAGKKAPLVIRDVGPWDKFMTVTNAAEEVVQELVAAGELPEGRRLLYWDSEGKKDELLVKNGQFAGFKYVPPGGVA